MINSKKGFVSGRLAALKHSLNGVIVLVKTEDSIKVQVFCAVLITILGFVFQITATDWMFQFLAIGLVLIAETLNTAIEEVADFIHPEYNKKIGVLKDIAAGAPGIAAIISLIIGGIIYIPIVLKYI